MALLYSVIWLNFTVRFTPVWPKWDWVTLNNTKGTFPDLQSLSQVRTGMTKDQLYYLLGRPHYNDGWRPVEWNYLFHFHTPGQGTDDVTITSI